MIVGVCWVNTEIWDDEGAKMPNAAAEANPELQIAAIRALEGAEDTKDLVSAFIAYHFRQSAFSIKTRVKTFSSTVGKVGRKELRSCDEVKDIIGFRIIDLYRVSVPQTFKRFYGLLEQERRLFVGTPLVKFYAPSGDSSYEKEIADVFQELGITPGRLEKTSAYSSIHLQIEARRAGGSPEQCVPVEIQFRSAIEDVWSEMEHKIKYKGSNGDGELEIAEVFRRHLLDQLAGQKQMLDNVEAEAGRIFHSYQVLDRPASPYQGRSEVLVVDNIVSQLDSVGLVEVASLYRAALAYRQEALELLKVSDRGADETPIEKYTQSNEQLQAAEAAFALKKGQFGEPEKGEFVSVILSMERAFNWVAEGNIHRSLGADDIAKGWFRKAQRIYGELRAGPTGYVMIQYRLAQVHYALVEYQQALHFLDEVQSGIGSDRRISLRPKHWLHADYRRFKGLVQWNSAEIIKQFSAQLRSKYHKQEERLVLYREATRLTLEAFKLEVEGGDQSDEATETDSQRAKCANNILSYVWEAFELGDGEKFLAEFELGPSAIQDFLKRLGGESVADIELLDNLERADTIHLTYRVVLKFEDEIGYRPLIEAAARRVIYLVARQKGLELPQRPPSGWERADIEGVLVRLSQFDLSNREVDMLVQAALSLQRVGVNVSFRSA